VFDSSKIEHIHPRSLAPCASRPSTNHHYDWTNLLVVCDTPGTCDGAKADKHLCVDIALPDTIGPDPVFAVDTLSGELSVGAWVSGAIRPLADRAIRELNLNDVDLRESRKAVVYEAQRRIIEEYESPHLVLFEMLDDGFPTTVQFACDSLE
jgi:hypothetical protein